MFQFKNGIFSTAASAMMALGVLLGFSANAQVSITCPGDIDVGNDPGDCGGVVNFTPPVGTGSGTNVTTTQTQGLPSGSFFPVGTTLMEFTVTNDEGDSDSCTFLVDMHDSEDPVFDCPDDLMVNAPLGTCEAVVIFPDPTVTDNCAVSAVQQIGGPPSGSIFPVGETNIDFRAFDNSGNFAFCRFKIIVNDITDPTITCPADINLTVTTACDTVVNYIAPVGSDACTASNTVQTGGLGPGATFPVGTTTETYVVTDLAGNTASCSFDINIIDGAPPEITCPGDIQVVAAPGVCEAIVNFPDATATDNCTLAGVGQTNGLPSGSTFTVGTHTIEFTAFDDAANSAVCSFTIEVIENEIPEITCPDDIVVDNDLGECGAVVGYTAPSGTDDCGGATTVQTAGLGPGATFPIGTTIEEYTVTDLSGNQAVCSFEITVNDTEDPEITCASDLTVPVDGGSCEAIVNFVAPPANDNCPGVTVTQTQGPASGSAFPVGTTLIEFTAEDAAGNTTTCTFNIIVEDDEIPVITCPGDQTVAIPGGACTGPISYPDPTVTDNCPGATFAVIAGPNNGDIVAPGDYTITMEATDAAGNTAQCSFNVSVSETSNPEIDCPSDVTVSTDPGVCEATVTFTPPTATDSCSTVTVTQTGGPASGSVFPIGNTTLSFTAEDEYGNTSVCSYDIIVEDQEDPVITCPADISVSIDPGTCEAVVIFADATATDNCPGVTVTQTIGPASGSAFPVGTTTIQFTAQDAAGNIDICSFEIEVTDDEDPTITCPADQTVTIPGGACTGAISYPDPTISDNCPGATFAVIAGPANGDIVGPGDYTITMEVTDAAGNTAQCSFNVSVEETSNPEIDCPSDVTVGTDPGVCEAEVTFSLPTATDSCSTVTVTQTGGPVSGSIFPIGNTTLTFTAEDEYGNTAVCSYDIIVEDQEDPVLTCPDDIAVNIDAGTCEAIVNFADATATDNCPGVTVTQTSGPASGSAFPVGTTLIQYTAEDAAGNIAICSFNIEVTDDEAPTITCPDDIVLVIPDGNCSTELIYADPTIADNCPGVVFNVVSGPASGDIVNAGDYVVELQAVDAAGNTADCSFNVSISETSNPVFDCPEDLEVSADPGTCEAIVNFTPPTATDSCSAVTVTQTGGPASGTVFPAGPTLLTFEAEDEFGNTATCSYNIIVVDDVDPEITCPDDVVVDNDPGVCEAVVTYNAPTADDNCGIASIDQIEGLGSGATFPVGTTIETYVATDVSGNTDTCSFSITVNDTELPTITCPADQAIVLPDGDCDIVVTYADPTTNDNCGVASLSLIEGIAPGEVFPVGTTTVTYEVTDLAGNTAQCSFIVEITENVDPEITCPADITIATDPGLCTAIVNYTEPIGTDNCPGATTELTAGLESGAAFPIGSTTVTYTVTDASGNTSSCDFTVTVTDEEMPIIDCADDITVGNDAGLCEAIVNYNLPDVTDNCSTGLVPVLVSGPISGSSFPVGTTIVEFEVTDDAGNTSSCSFEVTVEDTELPTITCPDNILVDAVSGDCDAVVTYDPPVANDNCPGFTVTLLEGIESGELFPVGATTVIFEVADVAGNTDTCSFTVTVQEDVPPTIDCPEDITVDNDEGVCGAIVDYTAPEGTDNCGDATTTLIAGLEPGSLFPVGTTVVTYEVTDLSGNADQCSFNVVVNDAEAPAFNCPTNLEFNADANCEFVYTFDLPTATDNCSSDLVVTQTEGPVSGSTLPLGSTTFTFETVDEAGNDATCSYDVVVVDNTSPSFDTCPEDATFSVADDACEAVISYETPTASDNCNVTVVQTAGPESNTSQAPGVYDIVFTATDDAGNATECAFSITVLDEILPEITCPDSFETCELNPTFDAATATDNCAIASITQISGPESGTNFPIGENTIVFEAIDVNGNSNICEFVITVLENAPRAEAGPDANVCDETSVTLNGNDPENALGTWTIIEGSGNIESPNNQSTDVTGLGIGENTFVWSLDPENGCVVETDTVTITVEPGVFVDAGEDILLEGAGSAVLSPTVSPQGGDFLWMPGDGLNCQDCANPVASPDETTLYYLTYTTPLGCERTDSVYVRVFEEFPNTITPDGDGVNDVWNIPGIENYPDVYVVIYNRWGNMVFESVGYHDPWNGNKNGEELPAASYFYVIDYKVSGKEILNGTVNIIR